MSSGCVARGWVLGQPVGPKACPTPISVYRWIVLPVAICVSVVFRAGRTSKTLPSPPGIWSVLANVLRLYHCSLR